MRTIGMVGGTSWISTIEYYRLLNKGVNAALGGSHSAKCVIFSLDLTELIANTEAGNGAVNTEILLRACQSLVAAGSEAIMICANTPHLYAEPFIESLGVPFLHIGDATGAYARREGFKTVGLLGTRPTMEEGFLKERFARYGVQTLIPGEKDREYIHRSVFDEFSKDQFLEPTRQEYIRIIKDLVAAGSEAIVLGCTEIPFLLKEGDSPVPTLDPTGLHVEAALEFMLG